MTARKLGVYLMGCLLIGANARGAEFTSSTVERLWPGDAPGALGERETDVPRLTAWIAPQGTATGAAMVVCPGGGYAHLAVEQEGSYYARWLNEQGISAFVLEYRLGSSGYHHPVMLNDAARALRMVRARAAEWKIDPQRIGIMGSSAGGHLASSLLTHFDAGDAKSTDTIERVSSRPDLGILCYPVITMGKFTHKGSRQNLLGDAPADDLVHLMSNDEQVTSNTPPTFIFHTADDAVVPVENALMFASGLSAADVPYELHVYPSGKHGMGLGSFKEWKPEARHPWVGECERWLRNNNFARKETQQ